METKDNSIGCYAPDFEIPGIDGQVHHLARYLDKFQAIGVVFIGNHSQYVELYLERLKKIQTEFQEHGFTLIGINANNVEQVTEESFEEMKSFAETHQLNFPYLRDPNQDVAYGFGVKTIPEVFLIDKKAVIRYGGAIDDSPKSAELVQKPHLSNSIKALFAGKEIEPKFVEPVGSPFQWRQSE